MGVCVLYVPYAEFWKYGSEAKSESDFKRECAKRENTVIEIFLYGDVIVRCIEKYVLGLLSERPRKSNFWDCFIYLLCYNELYGRLSMWLFYRTVCGRLGRFVYNKLIALW